MDAPHSLTQSIYEWLQTSTPSGGQGDGYTREGFFDTTFSQPMDKPPNKLMPTNADIITPSPRSCLLDDHHQDISDGAPHNLAQQTEDPKGAAGDQTELSHNPYARRLRRKTKEDKYEVKEGPARRCHREVGAKEAVKEKKRKRQETSGAALLHRYNADNVASDRLTLRPTSKLGLFGKGRASSPFRQKALPDLAFSEVKFLNQCRSEQLPIKQFYHNKRRALLDLKNEDISRFFSATGLEKPAISARSRKKTKISRSMGVSKMNGSILHDEPLFLGFGQHIPRNSFSPMKITASTPVKPIDSDQQNRSQFTWSQSPATTRTEVRRSGSTGKVLKNLPRSIEPDSEKENQIPDRVADSSELMRKLHAHIDEQTTKALSRDTSAGFIDELSELVDKWKDRREPRCPNKQSISFSQPLNQTNTQPVQPSISNTENDRQKLVHEVEDNTRCDYEKFGTKGVTIPHEDYQIASPIQDHVTTRPSELLPQRIPSAGDINGFPCHQPSAKNTTVLSIPLASIFEQQSKSDAAISCSKEFGVDIPGREATSRSSLPYSPHADPQSVIMLQTFDGLSQDLGEYYPNPCNRPYSQGKTPNTDQWTDLQQSRSPFIQTNSSTSRNHGRPYSRLSTVSNIPTENFEFATPNQRQTASSMTSCSRVPHGAHYRLLQDQETPAYARRIQQQVVGRNTVPSDRLEPENFWTPQKLY